MKYNSILYCMAGYFMLFAIIAPSPGQAMTKNVYGAAEMSDNKNKPVEAADSNQEAITIFMSGDVMTGRGIDQILPYPADPAIYESYMKSARGYVKIAEDVNGPIDYPVSFSYVWGDAIEELNRLEPDVRIINLETSVTQSDDYWKGKGIHYRMHPGNISILKAAEIDVSALANNHVLDWGYSGLRETLETLRSASIKIAGAGRNISQAQAPAVQEVPGKGRVIVFAFGLRTSGIPRAWAATDEKPGVNLLKEIKDRTLGDIQEKIRRIKHESDIIVASIHWGSNWGYGIPKEQTILAHRLIDEAGVDIIHGHSSHHVKGFEIYKDKLILYGCGDFINDYEGIGGYEEFRSDLSLIYFAKIDPSTGKLLDLRMTPTQMRRFRVSRASKSDTLWLKNTLNREGAQFGVKVKVSRDNHLILQWD